MSNDYPLEECAAAAAPLIEAGATVRQKYTCAGCGSRQTMEETNLFFTSGHCEECGHVSKIEACNYLVVMPLT